MLCFAFDRNSGCAFNKNISTHNTTNSGVFSKVESGTSKFEEDQ